MNTDDVQNDGALGRYLIGRLRQFREQVEEGTGQPIDEYYGNAALWLSDLCGLFELSEAQRRAVLGESGARHVAQLLETQVSLCTMPVAMPTEPALETAGAQFL